MSIIIPTFNREGLIGETLDSVIGQSYKYWECLVIDDGSTDKTLQLIQKYRAKDNRIQYINRPDRIAKGANSCRNLGLEKSKGEFVLFLDSDDLLHENKLMKQVDLLRGSSLPFCINQSLVFKDTVENVIGHKSPSIRSDRPFEDFLTKNLIIPVNAPLFRREFLINNNFLFDTDLKAGQEWDLFSRILSDFPSFGVIDETLDYLRQHEISISGQVNPDQEWNYFLARKKIFRLYHARFSGDTLAYFRFYFVKAFKYFLRNKAYKKAFTIWRCCLTSNVGISWRHQITILFSFTSFFLFKKGDVFLTKLH